MGGLKDWKETDAGQILSGWLLVLVGCATLLRVFFNGLDELDTPRRILGVILSPFLVGLGFWRLSGAEDDDE